MQALIRTSPSIEEALLTGGVSPGSCDDGLVFEAGPIRGDWSSVRAELSEAFELARRSARAQAPIVFVVNGDDLLGRRGAPEAMVATGLLSACRTAAAEFAKSGTPVNTLSVGYDTPPEIAARWIVNLLGGGTSGELVRLGTAHIGKALP